MNINEIISKKLLGKITIEEDQELQAWLLDDDANRQEYEILLENKEFVKDYTTYHTINVKNSWKKLQAEYTEQTDMDRQFRRHVIIRRMMRVAVAVLLLVGAGWLLWPKQVKPVAPIMTEVVSTAIQQSIVCGKNEAKVTVKRSGQSHIEQQQVTSDAMIAILTGNEDAVCEIETLSDKEFWVTLPDGSRVHLNYNARLIYPNRFVGDSRQVFLEGEAYFYIAKKKSHPFIVNTHSGAVKQYGTEFYINAPKASTMVVLVSGTVGVTPNGGMEMKMVPGQQLTANNGHCILQEVDTTPYTAWNEGRMVFDNCPLEQLMEVIGKWFNVRYRFVDDNLRTVHLSGTFDRYGTLSEMLDAISTLVDADIRMQDGEVILKK